MRLHRFAVADDFSNKYIRISNGDILNQWLRVLRLEPNDEVILINGQNKEARVKLLEINKDFAQGEILEIKDNDSEPLLYTTLYCSLLKKDNFEWVIQKATEVGIKEIVPLITKHTIKLNINRNRLEKIAQEAAEQSGRGTIPLINNPIHFKIALSFAQNNDLNLFFDPTGNTFRKYLIKNKHKIGVFIGPEGGWDEEEIILAKNNNCIIASLGKLILRAETAAIIASYLVINSN